MPTQRARTVIRNDSLAVVTTGIVIGLMAGLAVALPGEWAAGPAVALTAGLTAALIALSFGLLGAQVTTRYLTAAVLFRFSRRFSRRPALFLDWASNAGLLRTTGIRYQFRHETYRDW